MKRKGWRSEADKHDAPITKEPACAAWLNARQPELRAQITSAALDPFRGYANALRDSLSDAVQVLDAFHVVKLGTQVVDEVRRRVQQE